MNIGSLKISAQTQQRDDGCDITGSGVPIDSNADSCSFACVERKGDFDVKTRIAHVQPSEDGVSTGLMFRESNEPASPMFCVLVSAKSGAITALVRRAAGQRVERCFAGSQVSIPNAWLRLRRSDGSALDVFLSTDGVNWSSLVSVKRLYWKPDGLFGFVVSNRDPLRSASASFRDTAQLRSQSWYYPSSVDCLSCHTQTAGYILGVSARQLNCEITDPTTGGTMNQLIQWHKAGMFSSTATEEEILASPRLVPPSLASASLESRARSYLDVNCAYCHRPGGSGGFFDARFLTPLEQQNLLTTELRNNLGVDGAQVVAPGDLARSILFRRIHTTYIAEKMPPLARNLTDDAGSALLKEWILSLKRKP